jgi:hypothetical protein
MTKRALSVTLLVYLFILTGNLLVLFFISRAIDSDFAAPAPDALAAIDIFVGLVALTLACIVLYAFLALAMMQITANAERVWIPRPLGARQVKRSDLAAIRVGRLRAPLARGTQVYRFIRRDGSEAFHVQKGVFSQGDFLALADFLKVPLEDIGASSGHSAGLSPPIG